MANQEADMGDSIYMGQADASDLISTNLLLTGTQAYKDVFTKPTESRAVVPKPIFNESSILFSPPTLRNPKMFKSKMQ